MEASRSAYIRSYLFVSLLLLFAPNEQLPAQSADEVYHRLFLQARSHIPNQLEAADSLARIVLDAAISGTSDTDSLKAKAYYLMGIIQHYKAQHLLSAEFYRRALRTNHAREDRSFKEACLNNLGIAEAQQGNFQKAINACYRSLKLAEANGDSASVMQSWSNISLLEAQDKRFDKAITIGRAVLVYTTKNRDSLNMAIAHQNMGFFYSQREQTWQQAASHFQTASSLFEQLRLPYYLIKCQIDYANFLLRKRAYAPAREIYQQMLELSEASQLDDKMAIIYQWLARLELDTAGDNQRAGCYLAKSRELVQKTSLGILKNELDILTLRHLARANDIQLFDSTLMAIQLQTDARHMKQNLSTLEGIKLKYDIDKLEYQKNALEVGIAQKNTIMSIILLALTIALGAIGIISDLYRKQRKHLNTMYQLNQQLARQQPVKSTIIEAEQPDANSATKSALPDATNIHEQEEDGDTSTNPVLYQLILQRIESRRLYAKPNFSIHDLSEELKRNRRIISRCLREQGHTSFSVLINQYRINEARRLIHERGNAQELQEIAEVVGFNNRISFYRCFKDYTGFSPSAYLERVRKGPAASLEDNLPEQDL